MVTNGQRIDIGGWEPEQDDISSLFVEYFNDPVMEKIKGGVNGDLWVCKIKSLLLNENFRYIMLITPQDSKELGTQQKLSELNWLSLQTREMNKIIRVKEHVYNNKSSILSGFKVQKSTDDDDAVYYNCTNNGKDIPIYISLLKKKNGVEYQSNGTLVRVLETYQSVITWK